MRAYAFPMSPTIEKLAEQALALPPDARAQLADRLLASLDPTPDEDVQAQWTAEAIRRRDEIRSGAVEAIDGAQALEQVRRSITR